MKSRTKTLIALSAASFMLVAGCAQPSDSGPSETQEEANVGGGTNVGWSEVSADAPDMFWELGDGFKTTEESTDVFLGGSGSCPPIIETAVVSDEGAELSIGLEKYPEDTLCTADLRLYVFSFDVVAQSVTVHDPNVGQDLELVDFNEAS